MTYNLTEIYSALSFPELITNLNNMTSDTGGALPGNTLGFMLITTIAFIVSMTLIKNGVSIPKALVTTTIVTMIVSLFFTIYGFVSPVLGGSLILLSAFTSVVFLLIKN